MPADWRVELRGLLEARREADRIARELSGPPMFQAIQQATLLVTGSARRFASVDTGRWRASILPEVRVVGEQVVGIVGSSLDYGPYAHDGSRPHWPPISALVGWARRHHVEAFVVARTIARRGTKGDRALYRGLEANLGRIAALVERAVARIVRS